MAKRERSPRANRKYVPLAPGIVDHLRYLKGCRLSVYVLILTKTAYKHRWTGWKTQEIADIVAYKPRRVRSALRELAQVNGVTNRKYIQHLNLGSSPTGSDNTLTIVNPVLEWED